MRRLLNQLNFYVMPVFNVDGYHFSWTTVRKLFFFIQMQVDLYENLWSLVQKIGKYFKEGVIYNHLEIKLN